MNIKKYVVVGAAVILAASVSSPTVADEHGSDTERGNSMLDLSFEELFDIPVFSRPLLGLHHAHPRGELMVGYTDRHMQMAGMRDGTTSLDISDVFAAGYMVSPQDMEMRMHMFEAMYGVTDDVTIMVMLPFVENSMQHETAMGGTFATESSGIGDVSISGIISIYENDKHLLHSSVGLHFPTGSVDERGDTPMGADQKLPYPMQLGSGTYDPSLGITYLYSAENWSFGSHLSHRFRIGSNSEGYRLGGHTKADIWFAGQWFDSLTSSIRLHGNRTGNIHGMDPDLNPMMVPTADPKLRGGRRVEASFGTSFRLPGETLDNLRVILEYTVPIYESVDGPQLSVDHRWGIGLQLIF